MTSRYAPIEDYGIIGDLHTVALVGKDGSIDFLCLPSFDSPSVFAALLDAERGGRFQIAPQLGEAARKQLYLPDTNVLLTRFLSSDGVAELSDFMPVEDAGQAHNLVRRVKTVRGEIRFRMHCDPRFDYARATHSVERRSDREVIFVGRSGAGKLALRLCSSVAMQLADGAAVAEFTLGADESASFVLEVVVADEPSPGRQPDYESEAFKQTVNFWRRWVDRCTYRGRWRETVNRSALTLKLLTSRPHGSIVASPTFGLPEHIGGVRNWDYRYTWIRDSSFALYGLMRLGYTGEAEAFMRWVMARADELEPDGSLQIMYGIDGRHALPEETLPHLEGYMGSRPVRIGNAAYTHLQLDIYGELMDAVYLYDKYGSPIPHDGWTEHRAVDRLGLRTLAREGRGHLGGARRAPGVPLLAGDVLGGDRPGHPSRGKTLVPGAAGPMARRPRHDLSRHLRALLGSGPTRVRPGGRLQGARRRIPPDAAHPLRFPHRPSLALHAARHRAGSGE